ncbi:MAG: peptidyl-prolyl cis-trans isomerase [Alphaproteobacteria bacterium]
MVMQSLRDGAAGGFLKYILLGLLGMAVGGLVMTDIGGSYSGVGGVGDSDVVRVGDKTLDIRSFDGNLRRSLYRYNISPERAYEVGLLNEILAGEISQLVLQAEAEKLGIEIDNDLVAQRIAQIVKPQQKDGETLQETLERVLQRVGMSETDFMNGIKAQVPSDIIMGTMHASTNVNQDLLAQDLYRFQNQTRDIEFIHFPDNDVVEIEEPRPEQIERLYESLKSTQYKVPEYRRASVALLDPATVSFDATPTETELKNAYKKNQDLYRMGEQFVIAQAMVDSPDKAEEIFALVDGGATLKDATVQVMGDAKKYYDYVSFEFDLMLPALQEALSDRRIGEVVPPVTTMLGNHVVLLKEILPPAVKPFAEIRPALERELSEAKRGDHFYGILSSFEEDLINGETLETLKGVVPSLSISTTPFVDTLGLTEDKTNGFVDFNEQDQDALKKALFDIGGEDDPFYLEEMPSGAFAIMIVAETRAEHFQNFEDVKGAIEEQFKADQRRAETTVRMQKYLAELETGGITFEEIARDIGKKIGKVDALAIDSTMPVPFTPEARPTLFQTPLNGYDTVETDGGSILIKVTGYSLPEIDESAQERLAAIESAVREDAKEDAFIVYIRGLSDQYSIQVNDRLLERAYGQSAQQ